MDEKGQILRINLLFLMTCARMTLTDFAVNPRLFSAANVSFFHPVRECINVCSPEKLTEPAFRRPHGGPVPLHSPQWSGYEAPQMQVDRIKQEL